MPVYSYKIRDRTGDISFGEMQADDPGDLRSRLNTKGLFVISFSELSAPKKVKVKVSSSRGRVKVDDISVFSWQLYTMLDAGMTLAKSLRIIGRQTKSELLRAAVSDAVVQLERGESFSDTLRRYPKIFSRFFVQMIHAGEIGGVLDEILRRLAVYYDTQGDTRSKIRSAMTYPAILLFISISVAMFLVTYILPNFVEVFDDLGATLPLPTQVLLNVGMFIRKQWYVFLGGIVAIIVGCTAFNKTDSGSLLFDIAKLKLPIIGDLIRKATISRFAHTLSTLINAGIPILTSLEVVAEIVGNRVISRLLKKVAFAVERGGTVAEHLGETKIIPEMVVNMVSVGEQTGALDKMLVKVAEFYEREVDTSINMLSKILEPVLIVFVTVLIGFIAISIFLPMADVMDSMYR